MRNSIATISFVLFILLASVIAYYFGFQRERVGFREQPFAREGIIDFSGIDFKDQKFARLMGDFEFYWNQLLSPEDFNDSNRIKLSGYQHVPGLWNGYTVNGSQLGAYGYATYRLKIKVNKDGWYGIKIKEFDCAYKIWVNGTTTTGAGIVGKSKESMRPSWQRKEVYFTSVNREVDIILQVSNFQHRKGGPEDVMIFGPAKNIIIYKNQQLGIGLFLFAILLIMSVYHLVLYIYRRKDQSIIYFSILCFLVALRLLTTGEKILIDVFPDIIWAIAVRIEYLSFILAVPVFAAFLYALFPEDFPRWFVKWTTIIASGFSAVVIFTPVFVFSHIPAYYHVVIITSAVYALVVLFIASIKRRENAFILFGGSFFFFAMVINDILYYSKILDSSYLLPFGVLVMVFSQAFVLSKSISKAFNEVERLTVELDNHNKQLEQTIKERTNKIVEQKDKIENQKEEIERQAENLKSINQQLIEMDKFKENMTSMMVHDLKNPLSSILGFSAIKPEETSLNFIHKSGKQMLDLVNNILDVYKYEKTEMKLDKTKDFLYTIANVAYDKIEYMIGSKTIEFQNKIPKDHVVNADKEIVERVFSNIIANAIKYIEEEGLIRCSSLLKTHDQGDYFLVKIHNTGESIPTDQLESIFKVYHTFNPKKTGISYSTGIGLAFCKLAIESHGGEIGVESSGNKGVTFWFTLRV